MFYGNLVIFLICKAWVFLKSIIAGNCIDDDRLLSAVDFFLMRIKFWSFFGSLFFNYYIY